MSTTSATADPTAPPIPQAEIDYELVRGEVRPVTPVNYNHRRIIGRLLGRIAPFVEEHGLGDVGPEGGFVLERDPLTLLAPDISFVRKERIPPPDQREGFPQLAPDLVIEVLSPSNSALEVEERVALYRDAGVRAIWIFNPKRRTVTAHGPDGVARTLGADGFLDGGDVLPGFRLRVGEAFGEEAWA
jgi:Uma2 family endonuclease